MTDSLIDAFMEEFPLLCWRKGKRRKLTLTNITALLNITKPSYTGSQNKPQEAKHPPPILLPEKENSSVPAHVHTYRKDWTYTEANKESR